MSKIFKITLILFIILSSICSFSLATDIDMNITSDDNDTTENTTTNTTNTVNNNRIENEEDEINDAITDTDNEFTTITSVDKSSTDDGLGLSNILNILLIVVGVVLILLAIAILIRLHG